MSVFEFPDNKQKRHFPKIKFKKKRKFGAWNHVSEDEWNLRYLCKPECIEKWEWLQKFYADKTKINHEEYGQP